MWVTTKTAKIGARTVTDSLTPLQVQEKHQEDEKCHEDQLVLQPGRRQITENGIAAGGQGHGDRQDVIHEEGRPRNDAGAVTDGVCGYDVPAAAVGKVLDDAGIGVRDDDDRHGRGQGQEHGKIGMRAQGLEGFLGTVGGRRQTVGAQSDPGHDGNEGDLVEDGGLVDVAGLAEEFSPQPRQKGLLVLRFRWLHT